jgi:hypothetical protein
MADELIADPASPEPESLLGPFNSHAKKYPNVEIAVLALSTQVQASKKYEILGKARSAGISSRVEAVDYIDAYLAGLKAQAFKSDPCFLFIECAERTACAQILKARVEGVKRVRIPLHIEAISSLASWTEFLGRLLTWTETHGYTPSQVVLLDSSNDTMHNAMRSAFPPSYPIIYASGADLARYAADYAFTNQEELRQPDDGDDMGIYVSPAPISVVAADGTPVTIIHRSEVLPASRNITFTTSEDNQTSVSVEFTLGNHDARPEDRFIFAKVLLDGLKPMPKGKPLITVSVSVSEGWGNDVEVFEGPDRNAPDVLRTIVQIPDPFYGPAYDAIKPFALNPANTSEIAGLRGFPAS